MKTSTVALGEPTFRIGRVHVAAYALDFGAGTNGGCQILAAKLNRGGSSVPSSPGGVHARFVGGQEAMI